MSLFSPSGPRTRRVESYLRKRARTTPKDRAQLDCRSWPTLTRKRAIVFTDTADFTTRTLRDGILHFLMSFDHAVAVLRPVVRKHGGAVVKVEGDSLLLTFEDARAACAAVVALDTTLRRFNRSRPDDEGFRFSYGIGYGDVIELERDVFGLEVNVASKLGEDLAKPGEALLTPAAAGALDHRTLRRVKPYSVVTFKKLAIPIQQLRLR
jgi:adenylate cyclase